MHTTKKTLSLILSMLLVFSLLPSSLLASSHCSGVQAQEHCPMMLSMKMVNDKADANCHDHKKMADECFDCDQYVGSVLLNSSFLSSLKISDRYSLIFNEGAQLSFSSSTFRPPRTL